MKKFLTLLFAISCFTSFAFAEEVRGCTTRRVIYEGPKYQYFSSEESNEYYGWEITNHNSFAINVDLILYAQGSISSKREVKTQSIILQPKESYIFKREEHCSTRVHKGYGCDHEISSYFIEYKAYKL